MLSPEEKEIIRIIKNGGVGVMPTDTIYGLVGSANSRKAINRIYKIKKRNKSKKLIILISAMAEVGEFSVKANRKQIKALRKFWPGRNSIILNGTAFRLPAKKSLIQILKKTGPLVAPSANPEGLKPAENISQAKKYFGPIPSPSRREGKRKEVLPLGEDRGGVDFYLSGGTIKSKPSALIKIDKKGGIKVLRGILKNNGKRK